MPSTGRSLSRNRTNTHGGGQPFEYHPTLLTQYNIGAKTEIDALINRNESRHNRRNRFSEKIIPNSYSRYKIRSSSSLPRHSLRNRMPLPQSPPALVSHTSSFSVNYLNPDFQKETVILSPPRSVDLPASSQNKPDKKQEMLDYMNYLQGKDEIFSGRLSTIKMVKYDYEEIVTQIALCYTNRLIEKSSCYDDRDWSGSYLPTVGEEVRYVYAGGYGGIDGVTECRNVNLAAKKYRHLGFDNDEAMGALSHMYSLHHLLDGLSDDPLDPNDVPFKVVQSYYASENSDSSSLNLH